jgi:shikimate kinase
MSIKKTAFFLVGNYGVGKSTLIYDEVISQAGIFIETMKNVYVIGKSIIGADSLSSLSKDDVMRDLINNKDKNIVIAGNYYAATKDVKILFPHFKCVIIYLKTPFKDNAKRIKMRGNTINIETYNQKLKGHFSLMKNCKSLAKIYIVDNSRSKQQVKSEYLKIIANEKG